MTYVMAKPCLVCKQQLTKKAPSDSVQCACGKHVWEEYSCERMRTTRRSKLQATRKLKREALAVLCSLSGRSSTQAS